MTEIKNNKILKKTIVFRNQKMNLNRFQNRNPDVATAKDFYDEINEVFHFDCDPVPLHSCEDALEKEWGEVNYVNPPFDNIAPFVKKAYSEAANHGKTSVLLLPVRTHTKYFFDLIFECPAVSSIWFLKKGMKFENYERVFPASLCLVIMQGSNTYPKVFKPANINYTFYPVQLRPYNQIEEEKKEIVPKKRKFVIKN